MHSRRRAYLVDHCESIDVQVGLECEWKGSMVVLTEYGEDAWYDGVKGREMLPI